MTGKFLKQVERVAVASGTTQDGNTHSVSGEPQDRGSEDRRKRQRHVDLHTHTCRKAKAPQASKYAH